ncbi:hypothetical protein V6N12_012652 [Hibiscus sabdariffa]|uniref:Clathrin light chain n=1 Tax=Hibiscus sabdariffa TaxID=183260 RepID=A0ABR2DD53_9ROSI
MSTFADSFTQLRDESLNSFDSVLHQDGYDPSQQFDSFTDQSDHAKVSNDDVFAHDPYSNGVGIGQDFGGSDGSLLPPLAEIEPDEGVALREWRRLRSIMIFS